MDTGRYARDRGGMSDRIDAPVRLAARLPACEPPYSGVVFSSARTPGDLEFGEAAERMEKLVRGYLGHESARTPGGLGITVSYCRDVAAIEQWRAVREHRCVQLRGRAEWCERYAVYAAEVERIPGFARD